MAIEITRDSLIKMLREIVLLGFPPEQLDAIEALVRDVIDNRPIVEYVSDEPRNVLSPLPRYNERGEPVVDSEGRQLFVTDAHGNAVMGMQEQVNVWRIGQPSPSDPDATVFACALWPELPAVVIYTFKMITGADGKDGRTYHRELLRNFKHVGGPIMPGALFEDMELYLGDDEEPEPGEAGAHHTNGAAARA